VGRRSLIAVLLALAPVATTGCGAEEAVSPEKVARAAESTIKAGGARLSLDSITRAPGAESFRIRGTGVMDARGSSDIRLTWSAQGRKGSVRQVFAAGTAYMRSAIFGDLPGDKTWIKIDLEKLVKEVGLGELPQANTTHPREILSHLRAVGKVEDAGTEGVRGVPTTHYKAVVELDRLPELAPAGERSAARLAAKRLMRLTKSDEHRTEVWVDDRGLVRRTRDTLPLSFPDAQDAELQATTEFFDFGTWVAVEVPSPSEVVDATELAAREARKQQRD
jgi:hypothetical protein